MIQNELQYKVTQTQIEKFTEALAALETEQKDVAPWKINLQRDAMTSTLEELQEDVQEYELLKAGKRDISVVHSLDDLPKALIRARIAQGLTQGTLAERLGVTEQEVLTNETTLYTNSSLQHLKQVAEVLKVEIEGKVHLLVSK
jgi:DNA-binding XRE family transcriptional regulator